MDEHEKYSTFHLASGIDYYASVATGEITVNRTKDKEEAAMGENKPKECGTMSIQKCLGCPGISTCFEENPTAKELAPGDWSALAVSNSDPEGPKTCCVD